MNKTNNESWDVPISTEKGFINNKRVDYRVYSSIMLMSNSDKDNRLNKRYVLGNKMDDIKNEICEMTGLTKSTVNRHVSALRKMGVKQFQLTQDDKGKVIYILEYTKFDEDGTIKGGDFVTIPSDRLRTLINAYSDNTIKVYATLCWMCFYEEKHIPIQTIGNMIGIKNKAIIIDCIEALVKGEFITKRKERSREDVIDKNGKLKSVTRDKCYYMIR